MRDGEQAGAAAGAAAPERSGTRLAELAAAFSLAADVGFGQPLETGLGVCLLSLGLAGRLGLDEGERQRAYYLALVRHVGCTAGSDEVAAAAGDEIALRAPLPRLDLADPRSMLPQVGRHVAQVASPARRPFAFARLLRGLPAIMQAAVGVCEVAETLAGRLGLDPRLAADVPLFYERWDGKGIRRTASEDGLPRPVQVVQVAEAAESFLRVDGEVRTRAMLRRRRGTVLAPPAVDAFLADAGELFPLLDAQDRWEAVLAAEPEPRLLLAPAGVDSVFEAMADFADLRSTWLGGHSRGVAALAAGAARLAGCPAAEVAAIRRAALAHDLGRVSVSAAVWGKPGPLSSAEREAVRLHPYYTDRVLARPSWLGEVCRTASLHHERLDGSGYFRGCRAGEQPRSGRLLAASDVLHALGEERPHRPALARAAAVTELRAEVRAGRLDGEAVEAVLAAAGQAPRRPRSAGGLTARELEVLRLLARGRTKAQVAKELLIAPKTADAHVQHIYAKLGVSTRAAATLFAMQHGLLDAFSG